MLHTICGLAGKRIVIKQSPTSPGHVLLQVLTADREVQASITFDPSGADALGNAARLEAVCAEAAAADLSAMIGAGVGA